MNKLSCRVFVVGVILTILSESGWSHGGGLDKNGGHRSATGYHYHRGGGSGGMGVLSGPSMEELLRKQAEREAERLAEESRLQTFAARRKAREEAEVNVRTEPRKQARAPVYKHVVVSELLEIDILGSSGIGGGFKGDIRITSPESKIIPFHVLLIPEKVTKLKVFVIRLFLKDQKTTELPWATLVNSHDGPVLKLTSGKQLDDKSRDASRKDLAPPDQEDPGSPRVWSDSTGKFSVEAQVVSINSEKAQLLTSDNRSISVDLRRLSAGDHSFIEFIRPAGSNPEWVAKFGNAKAIDGDTIEFVDVADTKGEFDLAFLDSPESGQPFSKESTEFLKSELNKAGLTRIEVPRLDSKVAVVFVNGVSINHRMIQQGYAWALRRSDVPEEFTELERHAIAKKLGLWKDQNRISPWDWRKGLR